MKNLSNYITESFGGELIKKLASGINKRQFKSSYLGRMVQLDKIQDDDLKQLTEEEALKTMRSRLDPGYIFWYNSRRNRTNVSWGYDVVMTWDGNRRDVKTGEFASDATEYYQLINPERFLVYEIRKQRQEMKDGALALEPLYRVAEKNHDRYRTKLAQLQKERNKSELAELVAQVMTDYNNVLTEWIPKFMEVCQNGTPSYWKITDRFAQLSGLVQKLLGNVDWANHGYSKETIQTYINEARKLCDEIRKASERFLNEIQD